MSDLFENSWETHQNPMNSIGLSSDCFPSKLAADNFVEYSPILDKLMRVQKTRPQIKRVVQMRVIAAI